MTAVVEVYKLGLISYAKAFALQEKLQASKITGDVPNILLLLEHPPTLTLAKEKDQKDILVPERILKQKNIEIFPTDRGGHITWHGPGQIVGYPILNLNDIGKDIHQYIRNLEQVIMDTLKDYSLESGRDPQHVGVWVGNEKIAAIGVRVSKWVTKHGFALNVNSDLTYFDLINPCGLVDKGVTSLEKALGRYIDMDEVIGKVIDHFAEVFHVPVKLMGGDETRALLNFNPSGPGCHGPVQGKD
jgi:lipoyl(octanoyl) transferase